VRSRSVEELLRENGLLSEEVRVSREASRITARLVVDQFTKVDRALWKLQEQADIERGLRRRVAAQLEEAERREVELARARAASEAANRAKSTFLANMSHELRTPLNAIIGYAELVQEELEAREIDDLAPDLVKIIQAGKHLITIINDILDLSKIEAGKIELYAETFDVKGSLDDVLATVRPLAEKNNNRLVARIPAEAGEMHTDLVRVRQCLFNLLSNACKFCTDGEISLEVERTASEGADWITLRVADTGIGMSPEQIANLFRPFSQADASSTRKYGGTGLGLAITRRFCQMMGGDVTLQSEPGKGSVFTIRLPAALPGPAVPVAAPPARAHTAEQATGRPRVLVIDDDPEVREWMVEAIGSMGFVVLTASSGPQGLAIAREARPAAIILDVLMPGMDGWAVLSELKSDSSLAMIPVVMATICQEEEMGFSLGAADYLTKPVERERLLAVLRRYCTDADSPSILLVEDDPATRETLRRTVEKEGWTVVEAENGQVALDRLESARPQLVLLDLMMPVMDGFEFLRVMRQREGFGAIPVVVVTSKDLTAEDRSRLNDRVQRVIQKGTYSRGDLVEEIRRLLPLPVLA